ncbi:MAG TPA: Uma2 family endonuclease [Thermoanaerobaculia bacterium]|nr:Uma2 family endonuclease [Thermoanaerobaculia bacterium]
MAQPAYKFPEEKDGTSWPAQGEWTYEDYLRLPEDGNRYEVIRGILYVTAAPSYKHQSVVGELMLTLGHFVRERGLGKPLTAPFDVKLPFGIASPVQPDLIVLRTGNLPNWEVKNFEGVPDLVAEVLSPRTRRRDRTVKLKAYQDAAVPELWLVDPDERTVEVYVLKRGKYTQLVCGGEGDEVWSSVFPDFRLKVTDLFRP